MQEGAQLCAKARAVLWINGMGQRGGAIKSEAYLSEIGLRWRALRINSRGITNRPRKKRHIAPVAPTLAAGRAAG